MSIKIKSLAAPTLDDDSLESGYLYKDIMFDLSPQYSRNSQLNNNEKLKDIQALYDLEAVKNSIINCFYTSPGQKPLNPTFGLDLRQFLFEPIDDFTAEIIEDTIRVKLPRIEPRVTVSNVSVVGIEEENQYDVFLQIDVPSLNIYGVSLKSSIKELGITIL